MLPRALLLALAKSIYYILLILIYTKSHLTFK